MKQKNIEGKIYFFFDEIQQIENWEKLINGLRVSYDCDIYMTESNSKLLSGELVTLIAGRLWRHMYILFHLMCFVFFFHYLSFLIVYLYLYYSIFYFLFNLFLSWILVRIFFIIF